LAALYYACSLFSPRADARAGLRGAVVLYVVVAGVMSRSGAAVIGTPRRSRSTLAD
jgi:hypothetical protein